MKNMLIAIPLLLATACAAPPVQRDKNADRAAIRESVRLENACAMASAPSIDDGISDAATVALALALRCHNEYAATTEVVCATLDNDAQREMMRDLRAMKQTKVEAFLPEVMRHRRQMR